MGRLLLLGLLSVGGLAFAAALQPAADAAARAKAKRTKSANGPKVHTNWDLYATPESKRRETMLIPKVLHQTYKGMQLPSKFKQYRDTWVENLPTDWAFRLWTEKDLRSLIKDHYPWFMEVYDSYEQDINRIYAARVFLMHHYGGVYSDLDVEALHDPTPLFSGDYDLAFFYVKTPKFRRPWAIDKTRGSAMGVISNALMASVSKHPFWLFLAQRMMKAAKDAAASRGKLYAAGDFGSKQKDILFTTGSSLLTDALSDFQEKFPDSVVGVFGNRYWSPWKMGARDEICEGREACTVLHPDALLVHHWTGSWNHCTPGTCLAKAEEVVPKKVRKRRVMPAPPMLPDEPAAMPPPPPSAKTAPAAAQAMPPPPQPEAAPQAQMPPPPAMPPPPLSTNAAPAAAQATPPPPQPEAAPQAQVPPPPPEAAQEEEALS